MLQPQSVRKAQLPVGPLLVHCEIHRNEEVKHFCKDCNVLVCAECIVDKHNRHEFQRIKDAAADKQKFIQQTVENMKSKTIPEIQQLIKKAEQTSKEYFENGISVVNGINGSADELIFEINKKRKDMIQDVERKQSVEGKKLDEYKKKMEKVLTHAEELVEACPSENRTASDSYIVKLGLDLQSRVPEMEKEIRIVPTVKETIFIQGKITDPSLTNLFGHCVDKKEQETESDQSPDALQPQRTDHATESKLEVVSEFQHETDKGAVIAITTQDNQTAWISTYQGNEIKRVDQRGHVNKTLTFNNLTKISDIAMTQDGGLLVAPNGGSDANHIKKVEQNGNSVTFIDVKPLLTRGICVSHTGHIYVGCIDDVTFDVTNKSTRYVMKLSNTGIVEQHYQYDSTGQRLFIVPRKIQENINGDVWVCDRTAIRKARIVVIQQDGELKFVYTGVNNDKVIKTFFPCDMTAAGNGNMLICDKNNNIVYIVDKIGTLLYFLESQHKTGIYAPTSISVDRKHSRLWIGNTNGQIQILCLK